MEDFQQFLMILNSVKLLFIVNFVWLQLIARNWYGIGVFPDPIDGTFWDVL